MRFNINIEKSMERRRLTPSKCYLNILDYFTYFFLAVIFTICIIGPTKGIAIKIDLTRIILISLVLVMLIIVTYRLY
jgi:hypothetical protein